MSKAMWWVCLACVIFLAFDRPGHGQTVGISDTSITRMSLVGALQRDGVLPPGFIPAEGGIRIAPFEVYGYEHIAACLLPTHDALAPRAVVVTSRFLVNRWLAGQTPKLLLTPWNCEAGWRACWPLEPVGYCYDEGGGEGGGGSP